MKIKSYLIKGVFMLAILVMFSCAQPGGENPGSEYMPDMGHSTAFEANYYDYYSHNTWGTKEEYYKAAQPRKPVEGTIAQGYVGYLNAGADLSGIYANGSVPYDYTDTEEERIRATEEIIQNPYPITKDGLTRGKNLYNIYCGICHGEKGDGNGWLVDEANTNPVYPAQPATFMSDEFVAASNGRYYHSIIYGKNVMGGYTDKLSFEERWQVIHYIRSLQAKSKKLAYNETENTLNDVDIPLADWTTEVITEMMDGDGSETIEHEGDHQSDEHEHESGH